AAKHAAEGLLHLEKSIPEQFTAFGKAEPALRVMQSRLKGPPMSRKCDPAIIRGVKQVPHAPATQQPEASHYD
ncbi:hypothetical protein, partial [Mesorhizobium sp.]|uniref:hypothetical protein n=1 Tax=Mesorhizobium sp. TaxID=1871066 RepID=UPI0025D88A8D